MKTVWEWSKESLDQLQPITIFGGGDSYLRQQLLLAARSKWLHDTTHLDYSYFPHSHENIYDIIQKCLTVPFFSSRQIVVCDEAENWFKDDAATEYVLNPMESTVLLLLVKDLKKIPKKWPATICLGSLEPLSKDDVKKWMLSKLQRDGVDIEYGAQNLLLAHYAANMIALENHLDKLVAYAGTRKHISRADVLQNVVCLDEVGVFELLDTLAKGNHILFLSQMDILLHRGMDAHEIVGMFLWHFKRLSVVFQLRRRDMSWANIAQQLHLKDWALKKIQDQARHMQDKDIASVFEKLCRLDLQLKNNRWPSRVLLEIFALELCPR